MCSRDLRLKPSVMQWIWGGKKEAAYQEKICRSAAWNWETETELCHTQTNYFEQGSRK